MSNLVSLIAEIFMALVLLLCVILVLSMFTSMGCWVYYGTVAHDTAWLLKHCG